MEMTPVLQIAGTAVARPSRHCGRALPQGFEPAAERLRPLRQEPARQARDALEVLLLPRRDQRREARAPGRERLMRGGEGRQYAQVVVRAQPVAQALRLLDPETAHARPQRLDQLELVAMLDDA